MDKVKELVHKVLKWVTEDIDNPDLRDRGFMYWRMLALNPSAAGRNRPGRETCNNNRFR